MIHGVCLGGFKWKEAADMDGLVLLFYLNKILFI